MFYRCLFIGLIFLSDSATCGDLKFRAREHYEVHTISQDGGAYTYSGFSNTINFFYEKPFEYSLGLAAGPLIGSAGPSDSTDSNVFGNKIRLYNVGIEFKYFVLDALYIRPGLGWTYLSSKGSTESSAGVNVYAGLGYELSIENVGIALELAIRRSVMSQSIRINSFTPSIGLHFYDFELF